MSLDLSNYELTWPAFLFVSEGERILKSAGPSWEDRAEWLMTEALSGATAVADFRERANHHDVDPWASTASRSGPVRGGDEARVVLRAHQPGS